MNSLYWIFFIVTAMMVSILIIDRRRRNGRKYDERQEAIRNRGFRYGFLATAIAELFLFFIGDHLKWSIEASLMPFIIGVVTIALYDIFQRSYFPFNQKRRKSVGWGLLILGLFNLIDCVHTWAYGPLIVNLNNLIFWIGITLVGLAILYTEFQDKRDHE